MENFKASEVLDNEFKVDAVVLEKSGNGVAKGILIGAAVVGAGWLGTEVYKKCKARKAKKAKKIEENEENLGLN